MWARLRCALGLHYGAVGFYDPYYYWHCERCGREI